MAGIGFELKKLFKNKGIFSYFRAFFYSMIVGIGPFILATAMIISIQLLLKYMHISFHQRQLFLASIVYAFIFSQIVSSGFSMIITRYVSDKLYSKEYEDILPSLYGILTVSLIIATIPALLFLWHSPLSIWVKLATYVLYMELIIMWLQNTYLMVLKDYMKIVKSFLCGVIVVLILAYLILSTGFAYTLLGLLIAMDLGIFTIITLLLLNIKKFFKISANTHFLFITYFEKYKSLFFINLFYTIALYVHNFIVWNSVLGISISNTYVYAPVYDVPTFYAFISIMPSMVIFIVSVETSFYEKYKVYFSCITNKGNYTQIENARKDMVEILWAKICNILEIQFLFTLLAIVIAHYLHSRMGLIFISIDIFNVLALGAYTTSIMLVILITLLYFEDRKGALLVASAFLIANSLFTYITLQLGQNTHGFGFFVASFVTLIIGTLRLNYFIKHVDYYVFCSQPVFVSKDTGIITKLIDKLYNSPQRECN